ncbi:hypothetical protein RB195_016681 [Necator americanus]|uniref:G-protein coupled receptors family 1 profile domain-containing protein n=1 Tax=Necator americanus TaxID=51031 RepID=A0ABR1C1L7_NECAM
MRDLLECLQTMQHMEIPLWERFLFGTIMLIITIVSLTLNMLLAAVVFRGNLVNKSVQPHIANLIIASVVFLLPNCWLFLPTVLGSLYPADPYNVTLATPNTLGYFMIMFTTATMAIDRFITFFLPSVSILSYIKA